MNHSPMLKHGMLAGLAIVLGSLIAHAYDTNWISGGQAVSAMRLKTDLDEAQSRIVMLETKTAALENGRVASPIATGSNVGGATVTPVSGSQNCTVSQDGSWIAGATHPSVAKCQIIFVPNFFSAAPRCVASNDAFVSTVSGVSATGFTVDIEATDGGAYIDNRPIAVICVGPK